MASARWLGLSLALTAAIAVAGVGGAAVAACGSSSGGATSADAGADSITPADAGADDSSSPGIDVEAGPPIVVPKVYVVNASPDAPPLRFCLGLGAPTEGGAFLVAGGLPATPQLADPGFALPGLYPGFGAALDDHGLDLDTLTLDIFALDATNPAVVASTGDGGTVVPCEGLIGSDGLGAMSDAGGLLRAGRDYWVVGTIPMGALGHGTTWLAAVTGCIPGDVDASTLCPPGYDPNAGDLHLLTWQLDTTTSVAAGALGAQFVQASSEWEAFRQTSGGVTTAGFLVPGDGGTPEASIGDAAPSPWASYAELPVAPDAGFGSLEPSTLLLVTGLAFDGTTAFGAEVVGSSGIVPPTPFGWPLPAVQGLTWPGGAPDAGVLRDGAGFVFVLVGNPASAAMYVNPADGGPWAADAGGVLNGHYPHFLAFPVVNP